MSATAELPLNSNKPAPTKPRRFKYKFRQIAGTHIDSLGPPGDDGKPTTRKFKAGDIIDTDQDLAKIFGDKFVRLANDGEPAEVRELDYERLSMRQLLAVAEDEGVDLKGETKKDKIIAMLREARK